MTKAEMELLPRYEAAVAPHGFSSVVLHTVAKLCLRCTSAAAYAVIAGNQRKSKAWKADQLTSAHSEAIHRLRKLAR